MMSRQSVARIVEARSSTGFTATIRSRARCRGGVRVPAPRASINSAPPGPSFFGRASRAGFAGATAVGEASERAAKAPSE